MTQQQIGYFLDRPSIAHVTSPRADGSPHTVPVWYPYEDGRSYVFTPSRIPSRYRGMGGLAHVREVDADYGGIVIITLQPTRTRAWASET